MVWCLRFVVLLLLGAILPEVTAVGIFTLEHLGKAVGNGLKSWSYNPTADDGPDNWDVHFPQCGDLNQSPIDISYNGSEFSDAPPLRFDNWQMMPTSQTILNDGYSVQVTLNPEKNQTLYGGGLPGFYIFAQYHFHWGGDDGQGSEHTFDNFRFPLSLHLVFYNSRYETFGGLAEAAQHKDGLAVVAVMFRRSRRDNPKLTPLIKKLKDLDRAVSDVSTNDVIPLTDLVPRNLQRFFRYHGSLTTPTCNEAVTWTIMDHTLPVSQVQLNAFRDLKDFNGERIRTNFRPPQPLNGRTVLRSFR